jgi:hypothetical protein
MKINNIMKINNMKDNNNIIPIVTYDNANLDKFIKENK